jgi:hypothetical protein
MTNLPFDPQTLPTLIEQGYIVSQTPQTGVELDHTEVNWIDRAEFYNWVKDTKLELETKYQEIETECQRAFKDCGERKELAMYFQTQKYPGVLFLMLDKRDYRQVIWKLIKPDYQRPFRSDNERGNLELTPSLPEY